MRAQVLPQAAPIETNPLHFADVATPEPGPGEVLVKVNACAVCRTDLHVCEGELAPRKQPVIPGHQVVGTVEAGGPGSKRFRTGDRVGIAWLHRTCGVCEFCRTARENLCVAPDFTGWTVDGGYAEFVRAPEAFVYALPAGFPDLHVAPLLCAGIIGYRTLRLSNVPHGGSLVIYGFGAAAHVAIQVARHWGIRVYAATRDERHRRLALDLGAVWAGGTEDVPPELVDAAMIFAPAGNLVIPALRSLKRGGTVACGGIHMSPIPPIDYDLLYWERTVRSVANNTRQDGEEFLKIAGEIPIHTEIQEFALKDAGDALNALKNDAIRGAAVLRV